RRDGPRSVADPGGAQPGRRLAAGHWPRLNPAALLHSPIPWRVRSEPVSVLLAWIEPSPPGRHASCRFGSLSVTGSITRCAVVLAPRSNPVGSPCSANVRRWLWRAGSDRAARLGPAGRRPLAVTPGSAPG